MKTKLLSIILFFVSFSAFADVPQAISYQAVARNASGEIIIGKKVSIRVNLLQGSVSGVNVYSETHAPVSNQSGVITLQIGKGAPVSGSFSEINWGASSYFVKMEMDIDGGNQYVEVGTSQLLAVPYALYAESAGGNIKNNDFLISVDNGDTEDILYNGELVINDQSPFEAGNTITANVIYLDSKDQEVDCNLTGFPSNITFKKTGSKSNNYGRHFDFELTSDIDRTTEASYNCKMVLTSKAGITKEFPFVFRIEKKEDGEEPGNNDYKGTGSFTYKGNTFETPYCYAGLTETISGNKGIFDFSLASYNISDIHSQEDMMALINSGNFAQIVFYLTSEITTVNGIPFIKEGTYTGDGIGENAFTFQVADVMAIKPGIEGFDAEIMNGTITIQKTSGDNYQVSFNVKDTEGQTYIGSFQGKIRSFEADFEPALLKIENLKKINH